MNLCKGTSCPRYKRFVRIDKQGIVHVVKRSCYYEPGCILGWLDLVFEPLRRRRA
jgi:hypothetical protein